MPNKNVVAEIKKIIDIPIFGFRHGKNLGELVMCAVVELVPDPLTDPMAAMEPGLCLVHSSHVRMGLCL